MASSSASWSAFESGTLRRTMATRRIVVNTNAAPSAIGPYNQVSKTDFSYYGQKWRVFFKSEKSVNFW